MKFGKYLAIAFGTLLSSLAHGQNYLSANSTLQNGQYIQSPKGKYKLIMQTDGSLVMYRSDESIRYRMKKYGWIAVMQADGNFVEYNGSMAAIWATNTDGHPNSTLAIQDDGNLVIYSPTGPIWSIGAEVSMGNPTKPGDVVGRDLNVPGMSWAGHLGLWQGQQVVDVGPPAISGGNAVHLTPIESFKTASEYWGVASADIPSGWLQDLCYQTFCGSEGPYISVQSRDGVARTAYLIYLIGADYTGTSTYITARPATPSRPAQRGLYRCDTFVLDGLWTSISYKYDVNSDQNRWIMQYNNIRTGLIAPPTVFDKLKAAR